MQEKNKRRWGLLIKAIKTKNLTPSSNELASEFSLNFIRQKFQNQSKTEFFIDVNEFKIEVNVNDQKEQNERTISEKCALKNENNLIHNETREIPESEKNVDQNILSIKLTPPIIQYDSNILTGFNNTGNVKIWPSEEILTKFMFGQFFNGKLQSSSSSSKTYLELGGGYSSLASLFLAKLYENYDYDNRPIIPPKFVLTDGNEISINHCQKLIKDNNLEHTCQAQVLRWGEEHSYYKGEVDYLMVSDCFFFDEFRTPLKNTITHYLNQNPNLKVYLFAPSRNNTFQKFIDLFYAKNVIKGNCPSDISSVGQERGNFEIKITDLEYYEGQEEILFCEICNVL